MERTLCCLEIWDIYFPPPYFPCLFFFFPLEANVMSYHVCNLLPDYLMYIKLKILSMGREQGARYFFNLNMSMPLSAA